MVLTTFLDVKKAKCRGLVNVGRRRLLSGGSRGHRLGNKDYISGLRY